MEVFHMRNVRFTLTFAACLLLAIATNAQTQPTSTEPARTLGVSLALPDGNFIAYPIQHGTVPEDLLPIPIRGYKNVFGVRIYPHMSEDKVAVRIWAMVPKTDADVKSSDPAVSDPTKTPHEHRYLGDYVLGNEGDSLQVADFTKVGLPALTVRAVRAAFVLDSPGDPCCCTSGGLFCCGRTHAIMCATCPCPECALEKSIKQTLTDAPKAEPKSQEAKPQEVDNKKR
jgi:hypothetical protein